MTSSASAKARGAAWEIEVARFAGGVRARVNHPDLGDVAGIKDVVIEAKAQGRWDFPEWMRQLQSQVDTAGASVGLLAVKSMRKTSAVDGLWLVDPRGIPYILGLVEYHYWQEQQKKMRST